MLERNSFCREQSLSAFFLVENWRKPGALAYASTISTSCPNIEFWKDLDWEKCWGGEGGRTA